MPAQAKAGGDEPSGSCIRVGPGEGSVLREAPPLSWASLSTECSFDDSSAIYFSAGALQGHPSARGSGCTFISTPKKLPISHLSKSRAWRRQPAFAPTQV